MKMSTGCCGEARTIGSPTGSTQIRGEMMDLWIQMMAGVLVHSDQIQQMFLRQDFVNR